MTGRLPRWIEAVAAPRRALPILLSLVLITGVLGLSGISGVLQRGHLLQPGAFLLTPMLAAVYLAIKGRQFGRLLSASGLQTRRRARWLAFAIGEISLTLPFGIYAQNYVLKKAQGTRFADSATSTTVMLALEIGFLIVVLAVVPIPGWPQVRPILWALIAVCVVPGVAAARSLRLRGLVRRVAERRNHAGQLARGSLVFVRRLRTIAQPHVLLRNALLTAAYMLVLIVAFQYVGNSVSLTPLDFTRALTIYAFGLLIAMSLGSVLSQFGVLELSGAAAARAAGLGLRDGLAALLWFRLLWTLSIWLLGGLVIIGLRRELRRLAVEHD